MTGTAILAGEGYLRTVADLNWTIAGVGDFDGDGKADILWRNTSTGENYIYFMDGTAIKPGEGFIRTVADQSWKVAGIGDFDGDGRDDILWRNTVTGQNYLYPMDGLAIKPAEGYLRTVADLSWQIAGVGDFDGDGKADVLWRNSASGQNYIYPMNGTTILGTEGYTRTVADSRWVVALTVTARPLALPRFAYVANSFENTISMYTVNATTGQLRHKGYVVAGTNPWSVAVDPSGKFAYAANASSGDVSAFTIDAATGALSVVAGSPFAAGSRPRSVTVDPSGKFAYVANYGSNNVSAFTINAATGALAAVAGSPFAAGTSPGSVTVAPSGKFAYVANVGSN